MYPTLLAVKPTVWTSLNSRKLGIAENPLSPDKPDWVFSQPSATQWIFMAFVYHSLTEHSGCDLRRREVSV